MRLSVRLRAVATLSFAAASFMTSWARAESGCSTRCITFRDEKGDELVGTLYSPVSEAAAATVEWLEETLAPRPSPTRGLGGALGRASR